MIDMVKILITALILVAISLPIVIPIFMLFEYLHTAFGLPL